MSKKVISSLSAEDLELLSDMDFFLCTESVIFSRDELAVLKKLKHLHLLRYDTK